MKDKDDTLVWVKDGITKYEYPLARTAAEADLGRYTLKEDHPVRNLNGDVLPVVYTTEIAKATAPATNPSATPDKKEH